MEVLITEIMGNSCPVEPQVIILKHSQFLVNLSFLYQICRIMENDCIGFTVTNRGVRDLVIEKEGQEVVGVSVLIRNNIQKENTRR